MADNLNKKKFFKISYNWVCITMIVIYFTLLLLPYKFIPDYLNLSKPENSKLILRTIITVQGSIFGILFAVIILHFNLTKEVFGRSASSIIEKFNKQISYGVFLITSICLSFICLMLFDSKVFNNIISPVYYCSILFLIAIISVYPILIASLQNQTTSVHVNKMIEGITALDVAVINRSKNKSELERIQEIENNPIYILRETAFNVVQKEDSLLTQLIISKTTNKALELINDKKSPLDPKLVISVFNNIWDVIIIKAVEKKNYPTLNYLWTIYNRFLEDISSQKKQLRDYEELIQIFKVFTGKLIDGKFNTVVKNSFWHISKSIVDQLTKNCPEENTLSDIRHFFDEEEVEDKSYDYKKNAQWDFISRELTDIYSFSLEKAISSKNDEIFNEVQWSYCFLIDDINRIEIGEKLKHLLIIDAFLHSFYKCQKALDQNLFSNTDDIKVYKSEHMYKWLDENKQYFKRCMSILADFILKSSEDQKLGGMFFWTFNIGAIGRKCAQSYDSHDRYKECMTFVLDLLKRLQLHFEKNINIDSSKYLKLQEELASFVRFHEKENPKPNKQLVAQLKKEIKSFKKANEIQAILSNQRIKWGN